MTRFLVEAYTPATIEIAEVEARVRRAADQFVQARTPPRLNLAPGVHTFLCSIPGHHQAGQHGTLVVS